MSQRKEEKKRTEKYIKITNILQFLFKRLVNMCQKKKEYRYKILQLPNDLFVYCANK